MDCPAARAQQPAAFGVAGGGRRGVHRFGRDAGDSVDSDGRERGLSPRQADPRREGRSGFVAGRRIRGRPRRHRAYPIHDGRACRRRPEGASEAGSLRQHRSRADRLRDRREPGRVHAPSVPGTGRRPVVASAIFLSSIEQRHARSIRGDCEDDPLSGLKQGQAFRRCWERPRLVDAHDPPRSPRFDCCPAARSTR